MASNYSSGGYSYPYGGYAVPPRDLSHKASEVSALDPLDTYDAGNRDSFVSLPSPIDEVDISRVQISDNSYAVRQSPAGSTREYVQAGLPEILRTGTPTTPSASRYIPWRNSETAYAPVAGTADEVAKFPRPKSKKSSKRVGSLMSMSQDPIPEGDEIGMKLLGSASPMGIRHKTSYAPVEESEHDSIGFDVSSYSGPSFFGAPMTEEQKKEGNKAEAAGILTGGLGAGWKPDTIIRSTDLLANVPISPRMARTGTISRGLSFRRPSLTLTRGSSRMERKATVRELGQMEANKRGEIIEVIVEEPAVDISSFAGGDTSEDIDPTDFSNPARKSTIAPPETEVFFPQAQANWKPFSMRWPYISFLVIVSVMLAVVQEYLRVQRDGVLYEFTAASKLSTWSYFTFKYLPTIIAVSFGVLWQITDFEVKRLEPYYQLSKPGGALAAESINVDYGTLLIYSLVCPFELFCSTQLTTCNNHMSHLTFLI